MANTRELRRRIKSVKNTSQITKAMQMVAATKMRRAQNQALNGRPYNFNLSSSLKRLLPLVKIESHNLLQPKDSKAKAVILLTTDKSLCGALNTNVFRSLNQSDLLSKENTFYTVGKKGRQFLVKLGLTLDADFENLDTINFRLASQLSKLIMDKFQKGEVGSVVIVYPQFVSTLRQEPKMQTLLPIDPLELSKTLEEFEDNKKETEGSQSEYLFEPDPLRLLDYILVHFIQIKIYQALLETKASEHSARMVAMKNATDNAKELVEDLKLTYNQTRQAAITTELLEITTAQVAMQ